MSSSSLSATLDRIATRYACKASVSAMSFAVEQPSTGFTWGCGDTHQPFFVASITKLYTTAIIMQLRHRGVLTLDTRVAELLGAETISRLVVHDGHDYSTAITVRELLSHTSGVPDYYEQKRPDGGIFLADMLQADRGWKFEEFIEITRSMPARFAPSTPGKAHYSDTNFQLLGRIIEVATSGSFERALRSRIIEPLSLDDTWLFTPDTLGRYDEIAPARNGRAVLHIPRTIASFAPDGAVVSTPLDQLRFLRAFIAGELFPGRYLADMTARWNSVFSPLVPIDYGTGLMRYKTPRWQSPLRSIPELIGHSGSFGTVLYHAPERDLYISGTVNQMRPRSLPYPLLLRIAAQFS